MTHLPECRIFTVSSGVIAITTLLHVIQITQLILHDCAIQSSLSCSSQVRSICITSHNHKRQLSSSEMSVSFSLIWEHMPPLAASFRHVHQTPVALATESKIMKCVFCCYRTFSLLCFSFLSLMCDSVCHRGSRRETRMKKKTGRKTESCKVNVKLKVEESQKEWDKFVKKLK